MRKFYGSHHLKETKAWKVFSLYIRQRDGRCISCGVRKPWKELDAGHFIPGSVCGKELFFSELNVFAQCTACNRFRHGNASGYAIELARKDSKIFSTLDNIRRKERKEGIICRYTPNELQKIEEKYTNLLTQLNK